MVQMRVQLSIWGGCGNILVSWKSGEVLNCEDPSKLCSNFDHWEVSDKTSNEYISGLRGMRTTIGSLPAMKELHYTQIIRYGDFKVAAMFHDLHPLW